MSERLTDKALAELEDIALLRVHDGMRLDGLAALSIRDQAAKRWFVNLVLEVKERRAADLTDEDRDALADMRCFMVIAREHAGAAGQTKGVESSERILAVLDRLLERKP